MAWDDDAYYETELEIPSGRYGKLLAMPGGVGPAGPVGPEGPVGSVGPAGPVGPSGTMATFASLSAFPAAGSPDNLYVAEDTNDSYRWDGAKYVRVSERVLAAGITDSTVVGRSVVTAATEAAGRTALKAMHVDAMPADGALTFPQVPGLRTKAHPDYGPGYIFGTTASYGFNPPTGIHIPFFVYQEWNKANKGAEVSPTTQGAGIISAYWGPAPHTCYGTSTYAFLRAIDRSETSTEGFTQTGGATGFEAGVSIQGANRIENPDWREAPVSCNGARVDMDPATHADSVYLFKGSVTSGSGTTLDDPGNLSKMGTIGRFVAFYQENSPPNATTKFGVKVIDPVITDTFIGAGLGSNVFFANPLGHTDSLKSAIFMALPSSTDVPGTCTGIRMQGGAGQSKALIELRPSGAVQPASRVIPTGQWQSSQGFAVTDSTYGAFQIQLTQSGLTLTDKNIILSATTGTKIGTAATQKLAFWNAAPVAQPALIANAAADGSDVVAKFNTLLASLKSIGLMASAVTTLEGEPVESRQEEVDPSWWAPDDLYAGVEEEIIEELDKVGPASE